MQDGRDRRIVGRSDTTDMADDHLVFGSVHKDEPNEPMAAAILRRTGSEKVGWQALKVFKGVEIVLVVVSPHHEHGLIWSNEFDRPTL